MSADIHETSVLNRAAASAAIVAPAESDAVTPSPFHAAELAVQARAGVAARADAAGRRGIRDSMPTQHSEFFAELPFVLLGGLDRSGQPWASVRHGKPGFIRARDAHTLLLSARSDPGDPLHGTLEPGSPVGMLGIVPATRRRNRLNGVIVGIVGIEAAHGPGLPGAADERLEIHVVQSFGNCAKYIQSRTPQSLCSEASDGRAAAAPVRARHLSAADQWLLASSDTYFIASAHIDPGAGSASGVDISHRGVMPGSVRVDDAYSFTTPDYAGNAFFNTLGNLHGDARAGLLFIDFQSGDLLHVAADAQIIWEGAELAKFPGAQRLVRFQVREVLRRPGAMPYRWTPPEYAAQFAAMTAAAAAAGASSESGVSAAVPPAA